MIITIDLTYTQIKASDTKTERHSKISFMNKVIRLPRLTYNANYIITHDDSYANLRIGCKTKQI